MLQTVFRLALTLLVAGVLASCGLVEGDGRALQPLSSSAKSRLERINATPGSAMLVRIFKEESTLEVWKQTRSGDYALYDSYEICAWSGDLGPKIREGDRQSPEGFYTISPGLMNPRSNYYLAVNTGFPNKFDRAHGRTGSNLMIHGDCSSRGCYAMTDENIAQIYVLAREAFSGGQRNFQVQIYPFRMTVENMAKHYDNPNMDFWRNIKIGYDAFEISHRMPSWDVCEGKYIFNPKSRGSLDPMGTCPTESTEPALMAQVMAKQAADNEEFRIEVASIEEDKAKAADRQAKRDQEAEELKQRTAEVNAAVAGSTSAISDAVGGAVSGFFSIFGGSDSEAADAAEAVADAPYPADPIR